MDLCNFISSGFRESYLFPTTYVYRQVSKPKHLQLVICNNITYYCNIS